MNYVKQFNINGIDTKQVACIELQGKPNAATEGAVGLLGIDMTSRTHEVYKCVAVNGSVYTWELLSTGMSIISSTYPTSGGASAIFPFSTLRTPTNYIVKVGDLILDREGYLYQVSTVGSIACNAAYCGTHIGGMASGDKDYSIVVNDGKLQLVTESGAVISAIDYLFSDDATITCNDEGKASVRGIYTINNTLLRIFFGTKAAYNNLTAAQKTNLFPILTDDAYVKRSEVAAGYATKTHSHTKSQITDFDHTHDIYAKTTDITDGTIKAKYAAQADTAAALNTEIMTYSYADFKNSKLQITLQAGKVYAINFIEMTGTSRHAPLFLFVHTSGYGYSTITEGDFKCNYELGYLSMYCGNTLYVPREIYIREL